MDKNTHFHSFRFPPHVVALMQKIIQKYRAANTITKVYVVVRAIQELADRELPQQVVRDIYQRHGVYYPTPVLPGEGEGRATEERPGPGTGQTPAGD